MSTYRKPAHLCITKFCRHLGHPKRGGLCGKCSMAKWRAANPLKHRLAVLRHRAARKRVPFDLDLPWLAQFLLLNYYDPTTHHIDREKPHLGYVKGNLQILPMAENIAKGNRERWLEHDPF